MNVLTIDPQVISDRRDILTTHIVEGSEHKSEVANATRRLTEEVTRFQTSHPIEQTHQGPRIRFREGEVSTGFVPIVGTPSNIRAEFAVFNIAATDALPSDTEPIVIPTNTYEYYAGDDLEGKKMLPGTSLTITPLPITDTRPLGTHGNDIYIPVIVTEKAEGERQCSSRVAGNVTISPNTTRIHLAYMKEDLFDPPKPTPTTVTPVVSQQMKTFYEPKGTFDPF